MLRQTSLERSLCRLGLLFSLYPLRAALYYCWGSVIGVVRNSGSAWGG